MAAPRGKKVQRMKKGKRQNTQIMWITIQHQIRQIVESSKLVDLPSNSPDEAEYIVKDSFRHIVLQSKSVLIVLYGYNH